MDGCCLKLREKACVYTIEGMNFYLWLSWDDFLCSIMIVLLIFCREQQFKKNCCCIVTQYIPTPYPYHYHHIYTKKAIKRLTQYVEWRQKKTKGGKCKRVLKRLWWFGAAYSTQKLQMALRPLCPDCYATEQCLTPPVQSPLCVLQTVFLALKCIRRNKAYVLRLNATHSCEMSITIYSIHHQFLHLHFGGHFYSIT